MRWTDATPDALKVSDAPEDSQEPFVLQDEAQTIENHLDFIDTRADFEPVVKQTARLRILEQHSYTEIATLTRAKAASTAMRRSDKVAQRAVDAGFRMPPLPELEDIADGRNAAILDPQYTLVGNPELRTPGRRRRPVRILRGLSGKARISPPQESPNLRNTQRATPTATPADVADQPEGSQCNASLGCDKRNTDGHEVVQRNAGARPDATHNRSCEPGSRRNTTAPSSSTCAVQPGGRRVAYHADDSFSSPENGGGGTSRHSIPGQVDPVARSSAKPLLRPRRVSDDPGAPDSARRPDLSRFISTVLANAAPSVSTVGAAHSGHQFKSPDGMRSADSPYGLRGRRSPLRPYCRRSA